MILSKKLTTSEFIQKANKVHNHKYTYPDEYINVKTKIKIICPIHGEFYQRSDNHLSGQGCPTCSTKKKLKYKEFIYRSNAIHNNQYEYPDEYINSYTKVRIICPVHGDFFQTPNKHLSGHECTYCNKSAKLTNEQFIQKAHTIHNNKYEYPDEYTNARANIRIICPIHGEFYQQSSSHLSKHGCPSCSNKNKNKNKKLTTKIFITRSSKIHNNKYDYPNEYINARTKIKVICPIHGEFYQRSSSHLNEKQGCQKCTSYKGYSKKSISWLNEIAKKENIHIHHAENGGEYSIPRTKYKADGYCEVNNTIYEFYGDCWHGNLELYEEDEQCHPFSDECAGSLYIKTMQREQIIKDLGYNLITIWEREYKCLKN